MDKYICIKDYNEHFVFVKPSSIIEGLQGRKFEIFDMGFAEIPETHNQYPYEKGELSITKESIKEVFS